MLQLWVLAAGIQTETFSYNNRVLSKQVAAEEGGHNLAGSVSAP